MAALAAHGECGARRPVALVELVLGRLHADAGVDAAEGQVHRVVVPEVVGAGHRRHRRQHVDPGGHRLRLFDVAGQVHGPIVDGVSAVCHEGGIEALRPGAPVNAVLDVVDAAGVACVQGDDPGGRVPGGVDGARGRDRVRPVDLHLTAADRLLVSGVVSRAIAQGVDALRSDGDRLARRSRRRCQGCSWWTSLRSRRHLV